MKGVPCGLRPIPFHPPCCHGDPGGQGGSTVCGWSADGDGHQGVSPALRLRMYRRKKPPVRESLRKKDHVPRDVASLKKKTG